MYYIIIINYFNYKKLLNDTNDSNISGKQVIDDIKFTLEEFIKNKYEKDNL